MQQFIQACTVCQLNKTENVKSPGLIQPLEIPTRVWEDISMDFIEALPLAHGKSVIMVVVDRLSKYARFMALSHPYSAASVGQLFLTNVYKLHGMPKSIVSDRDPVFTSIFWQELFKKCKVSLKYSSAYHPQSDGQTEVVNRCLETFLRCMCTLQPQQWIEYLPLAEWWYNTNFHSSIQATPYEILYGQKPPIYIPYLAGRSANEAVDRSLNARTQMLELIKHNLHRAQNRMAQMANRHRSDRVFMVDDWVYLKLQPFKQGSLMQQKAHKLSPKYAGPFQIIECIDTAAYRLQLPPNARIHNVFHVSLLKRKSGDTLGAVPLPDVLFSAGQLHEPEKVLARTYKRRNNTAVTMWLVKWKGKSDEDATWEVMTDLLLRFPTFNP